MAIVPHSNMHGNEVRNVGTPKSPTSALPWSIPDYTTAERDALNVSATSFLLIMNTTTGKLNFYDGSAWRAVTST